MAQKFVAYNVSGAVLGFFDAQDSPVPSGWNALAITDAQWHTALANPGYTVSGGVFTPPSAASLLAQTALEQSAQLKTSAQAFLTKSDVTLLRCLENSVAVPSEWKAFRMALRSVIDGSSTTLPTTPAYPAGT